MKNFAEMLKSENKFMIESGQLRFDEKGIYTLVQDTDTKEITRYYIEVFQKLVPNKFVPRHEAKFMDKGYSWDIKPKRNINWGLLAVLGIASTVWLTLILILIFG